MRHFKVLVLSALLLGNGAVVAESSQSSIKPAARGDGVLTVEQVRALQSGMKKAEHLSVDFVQTTFSALRSKSSIRKGKAKFSQPNRLRWTLQDPVEERIFDGDAFYIYDVSTQTAARYKTSAATAREATQVVDLVLNFDSLLKRFDVVKATAKGDLVAIELEPKKAGEIVAVELRYDRQREFVSQLQLAYSNKNKTTYVFSSPQRTSIVSNTYALPAGVKVTDSL